MFFFELPRTTKVKKYFVAGITSPPKKEITLKKNSFGNVSPSSLAQCSSHGGRVVDCLRKTHGRCVLAFVLSGLYLGISTKELTELCQF